MSSKTFRRPHIKGGWALPLALCFGFCLNTLAQGSDEARLRAVAESYFAAYQAKDLARITSLWSAQSPDLDANRRRLQQTFGEVGAIELKGLTVNGVRSAGGRATLRLAVEMYAAGAPGGGRGGEFGKVNRTLELVSEGGEWRVWRLVSSEEELAAALFAAETDAERRRLLADDAALKTGELVRAIVARGHALTNQGSYAQSLEGLRLALELAGELGDKSGAARALRERGTVYFYQGDYAQASEHYRRSLELAEESGDREAMAYAFNNMGNLHNAQGNYAAALEHLLKSLRLWEEAGDRAGAANTLYNIGLIYGQQGDYARALLDFQRALDSASGLGDKALTSKALNSIAGVHVLQRNYPLAVEYFRRGIALAEEVGNVITVGSSLNNLGVAYREQGDYARALECFERARKIAEELGVKVGVAHTRTNVGLTLKMRGDYAGALEHFQAALRIAEELGDRAGSAATLLNIGGLHYAQGDYARAAELGERAAAIAGEVGAREVVWSARTLEGRAYLALGQHERARPALAGAISTIEQLREQVAGGAQEQQLFFEDKVAPYYAMVDLLVARGEAAAALAYAEQAKGRVLLDVLRGGRVNVTKSMTPAEQEEERRLSAELASLNTQLQREGLRPRPDPGRLAELGSRLEKARLVYQSFQANLYAAHPELKVRRGETPPFTPERAAALLPDERTAVLEFVVGEEKSHLFVLTRGAASGAVELKAYPVAVRRAELAQRVRDFGRRVAERNLKIAEGARSLYDLLLAQARPQLRGKSTLCIVPDGPLWELPFQAVQTAPGRYLIEEHAVFYAPSLNVLYEMTKLEGGGRQAAGATRARKSLLAFGNPALGGKAVGPSSETRVGEELQQLPEAEREVNTVGRLYGRGRSNIYTGAEASEGRAKAEVGRYRVLHFATHGVLDDANPMYSHLVLSRGGAEDGLLESWEIMRLELQAELVVLSACQTARGHLGAGEGVIGMSWALFVAGSPTTVVSLWEVESASTTEMMIEFHRGLTARGAKGGLAAGKAAALRTAALKLLRSERYAHPAYWAGFVLVGDGLRPVDAAGGSTAPPRADSAQQPRGDGRLRVGVR